VNIEREIPGGRGRRDEGVVGSVIQDQLGDDPQSVANRIGPAEAAREAATAQANP
jgi:hypothetical protein